VGGGNGKGQVIQLTLRPFDADAMRCCTDFKAGVREAARVGSIFISLSPSSVLIFSYSRWC
jgi:hypothetical protein